ncbi:opine metallophore biosynthesis dehydrogenase, partial [Staphylococcus epidermidis]|uniref:opine metallophore biosynthesis dehydrogenase n=1 Tax=Staphylococcus epidermidis TaxID=1282 RepID=UPI0037D99C23
MPDHTIPELHMESCQKLSAIHQHYLLYLPYTPILIHPFSNPHHQPPYFHFSPLPYKHLHTHQQPVIHIPPIPSQHYYPTFII